MLGLASNSDARHPLGLRFGWRGCPALSHLSAAGGTAKVCADWAFVSGVSPVPLTLKITNRIKG